jgi:hypothetical protein
MTIDIEVLELLPAREQETWSDDTLGLAKCTKTCDFTCSGNTCKVTQQ